VRGVSLLEAVHEEEDVEAWVTIEWRESKKVEMER